MSRVFVTGATGFLGRLLVERLVARGDEVLCLMRRQGSLPAGAQSVSGDLDATNLELPELSGVDVVFHCAAATRKQAPSREELFRINGKGTALLAAACQRARVRLVLASSLAAVGPPPSGTTLTEETRCRPVSLYGESKLASERAVTVAGIDARIVRLPGLYGVGDQRIRPLFRMVARGLRPMGSRVVPFLHVSDAVEALLRTSAGPAGVYQVAEEGLTMTKCGGAIAAAIGRPTLPIPVWPPLVSLVDRERAREISGDWRVSNVRLLALGWKQTVPFADGARELASAFGYGLEGARTIDRANG